MAFANEYREQHPKKIILNVGSSTFDQIEQDLKTLEMRLKKDNRTKISVGDIIIFKMQTGEDQRAEDEVTFERKVVAVRSHLGLDAVINKEEVGKILPTKPDKKEFKQKLVDHYKKVSKNLNLDECEFEIIEVAKIT
jgi:ASC-1-like (ASCH) protein